MNESKLRLIALVMAIGMLGIAAVATTTIITTAEALTVGCPEDLKFVIEASSGKCVREVNPGPPRMD